jgi:hypothetical protein
MSQKRKFIQINLHHGKAVTALLSQKLATGEIYIALIQEPWVYADQIRRLHSITGTMFSAGPSIAPRACSFVRNTVYAFPPSGICSRDVMMVRMTYISGRSKMELTVTSAYLPYDSDKPPPSKGLREVVYSSNRNKLQLIVGCDASARHIIRGSTDIPLGGEYLMEYLVSTYPNILKKGKQPNLVISKRKEVIDLTLGTNKTGNLVTN